MKLSAPGLCFVLSFLAFGTPLTTAAQDHPTGLNFLDPAQYDLLPKAKAPVGGPLPDSATLEYLMPTPQDQGHSNSCAAFAVTSNKAYRVYMASGQRGSPDDYLQSPGFPYSAASQRRNSPQAPACHSGTYISDELDFLSEIGSLPLTDMPFRPNVCEDWRSHLSEAKYRSLPPYGVLPDASNPQLALSVMKNLIVGGNPIIVGISACGEFQNPVNGYIGHLDQSGSQCGGHAVLVVGYDDRINAVRILNSWGDSNTWRGSDNGKVWMSYPVFMQRYREGYVDQGPALNTTFGGSYAEFAKAPVAEPTSAPASRASLVLSPDALKASLRSNIGAKTGKKIVDADGKTYEVAKRYLWLDLPAAYADQVQSVSYRLIDETFPKPFVTNKNESSVFLVWWKGWDCVDEATVTATLVNPTANGGKPIEAKFNYCSLGQTERPK